MNPRNTRFIVSKQKEESDIVLPRSNDHVYICLFVNIEIITLGAHNQQPDVVLKTV